VRATGIRDTASICRGWSGVQMSRFPYHLLQYSFYHQSSKLLNSEAIKMILVLIIYCHNGSDPESFRHTLKYLLFNVAAKWLALLLRIRNVQGSNLGPETGYPVRLRSWFSSVIPYKHQYSALNYATTASFHILCYSLIILSFDASY
jgi:hypothetical protein